MIKYAHETGAAFGSFERFPVQDEIVLTSVLLQTIAPEDEIELEIEIGWDNSYSCDMGELDIMLRRDGPNGEIVYRAIESCYAGALTLLRFRTRGGAPLQIYYLTVRSDQGRALLRGPYRLKGTVFLLQR